MADEEDGNTPSTGPQAADMYLTRYAVEIDGLADFAAFVEREVTTNIRPAVDGIHQDFQHGLKWGRHIRSDAIQQQVARYAAAQYASKVNLTQFVREAEILIEVIRQLMVTYQTSEEMAGLTLDKVDALVDSVRARYNAANPEHPPQQHGFQEHS